MLRTEITKSHLNNHICQHRGMKTSTVTPSFYYVFNISLYCNDTIPSFIGNLWRVLFSLRSSRFLSFSNRSRTGGKLRESAKISSSRIPFRPTTSPFLLTPLPLLPNFFAHPRHAPSLACSISARTGRGKESAAAQARFFYSEITLRMEMIDTDYQQRN